MQLLVTAVVMQTRNHSQPRWSSPLHSWMTHSLHLELCQGCGLESMLTWVCGLRAEEEKKRRAFFLDFCRISLNSLEIRYVTSLSIPMHLPPLSLSLSIVSLCLSSCFVCFFVSLSVGMHLPIWTYLPFYQPINLSVCLSGSLHSVLRQ